MNNISEQYDEHYQGKKNRTLMKLRMVQRQWENVDVVAMMGSKAWWHGAIMVELVFGSL